MKGVPMSSPSPTPAVAQPNTKVQINGIYDDYRKAYMNRLYYGGRVEYLKKINLYYEIVLAVGTSGTVAAWYVWQTSLGKTAWPIFGGVVALLSILKPILKLPEKVEKLSKLQTGYTELYYELDRLRRAMEENGGLTSEILTASAAAQERYRKLAIDDEVPDEKLLKKCFAEVKRLTTAFSEWYPRYIA
jgi:hypothetical protein